MFALNRPLILICIFFSIGILAASLVELNLLFCYVCLGFLCLSSFFTIRRRKLFVIFLALSCFCLGYCHFLNTRVLPSNHISNFTAYKGENVRAAGVIISEQIQKKKKSIFTLQVKKLIKNEQIRKVKGKVLVNLYHDTKVKYGQEVILTGKLYRPHNFSSSDMFDYRKYLKGKGIYSIISITKHGHIEFIDNNRGSPRKRMTRIRNKIEDIIDVNLSQNAAGIIKAMILGQRQNVPDFINKALQKTGTVHVLAVSGLHTGIIIVFALIFFRTISMHYRLRYFLIMLVLVFYCWFTGNRISVFRATIMGSVFLFAEIINRDYDPLSALSLGALIILWFNPSELFHPGFQLSFLSVLSIFLMSGMIAESFPQRFKSVKLLRVLIQGISVSLGAWIGTIGIVAYYFKIFTPVSVLANLLIIPLLFLIILSAVLFIFPGMLIPALAHVLALNCEFFVVVMYKVNSLLISIPWAYIILKDIPIAYVFLYYSVLLLVCLHRRIRDPVFKYSV